MRILPAPSLLAAGLIGLVLCPAAMAGGPFAPPGDGPAAFRLDRIPLEVEEIRRLSAGMVTMAETVSDEDPGERRLAAQCLAMALALEPGNSDARRLLQSWTEGRVHANRNPGHAHRAMEHGAGLLNWLENEAAGRDASQLAACLKDVICRVGRDEERYRNLGGSSELGRWNGWVPAIAAYEKTKPVPGTDTDPGTDPGPNPPAGGKKDFELTVNHAEITIPLWYRADQPVNGMDWVLKPGRMIMNASHEKGSQEFFAMGFTDLDFTYGEKMETFSRSMAELLSNHHAQLPYGLQVRLGSPVLQDALSSGRPQTVSAATVVLANSAITGTLIDADTILLGRIDSDGSFRSFSNGWASIRCFGGGKGQRLVIPADSREYMEALLTLDEVGFFLDYEVVMASNLEELFNATASKPEGKLGEACEKFHEIQKVAQGNKVRTFVANSHVRRRLQEVVELSPQHLSATLLLMQSNSSRPFNISRNTLVSELKLILQPFEQVREIGWDQAAERNFVRVPVGKISAECKAKIDALEKYVGREERELYRQVDGLYDAMKEYDRALDRRGDYDYITGLLTRTSRDAERAYKNYISYLDEQVQK